MASDISVKIKLTAKNDYDYFVSIEYKKKSIIEFNISFASKINKKFLEFNSLLNSNTLIMKDFMIRESVRNIKKFLDISVHEIGEVK